jgi:hypothetical protein
MLMIQPPLDMSSEAYRHAVVHAQRLSENVKQIDLGNPLVAESLNNQQNNSPAQDLLVAKIVEYNREMLNHLKEFNKSLAAFIEHIREIEQRPYHSLWEFDSVWSYGLDLDAPNYKRIRERFERFDESGEGVVVVGRTIELERQMADINTKVGRMIKRSMDAHEKRKRVVLPTTEAEMDKRAERFARQNRKVISELSRI